VRQAVVRVLGTPRIVDAQAAGRPVRQAALELLVYLAVHPEGAAVEQICDDLWPGVRRFQVAQRLHTAASNLRHLLAAAAGADPKLAGEFAGKQLGRYPQPQLDIIHRDIVPGANGRRQQQHRQESTPDQRPSQAAAPSAGFGRRQRDRAYGAEPGGTDVRPLSGPRPIATARADDTPEKLNSLRRVVEIWLSGDSHLGPVVRP
jgi:hypothetical protein